MKLKVIQSSPVTTTTTLLQGLLMLMMLMMLMMLASLSSSLPVPAPAPLIPSGVALVTAPLVCPLFYVGKAVRTAQAALGLITG